MKNLSAILMLGTVMTLWSPILSAKPQPEEDQETLKQLELFADVFARVRHEYVTEISDKDLIGYALNGALGSLDPHSSYVPPTEFKEQRKAAKREYGGLGIEVTMESGLVKINHAVEDGPAYAAGLRGGDYITAVDLSLIHI